MPLPPIPPPPLAHLPSWYEWLLATGLGLSDVLNIAVSLMALAVGVGALIFAKQQVRFAQEQAAGGERMEKLTEEQRRIFERLEKMTERQGEIAEIQFQIMQQQLAKRQSLTMFLRSSGAHIEQVGGKTLSVAREYLISVQNSGDKTARDVYWRVFLTHDERLEFVEMPDEFDMAATLLHQGENVFKGEGRLSSPVLPGGMTNAFSFKVRHQGEPDDVVLRMKGYLRSDEGRFPPSGDVDINLETVGLPPKRESES